jgi:hypothetical protein
MGRKPSITTTLDFDVYAEMRKLIKEMGEDPDARGIQSRYIEDAVKGKNKLVEKHKWVSADDINADKAKLQ